MKKILFAALTALLLCIGAEAATFKQLVSNGKDSFVEIEGNFDLAGATVKIPDNCTLFFKGGKITNGTIDFNGCRILGTPNFQCDVTGDVANDFVDLGWFALVKNNDSYDNGPIINKVAKNFTRILLPAGRYAFSTPIVIPNVKRLEFNGDLVYRGARNTMAVTVTGTTAVINFYGMVSNYQNKNVSFANSGKSSNMVGIVFKNVNNSMIYVNEVKYFNENIRVAGIGDGCCYNKFTFGLVRNANVGIRVYQEDAGGKQGWANENLFTGGRFANFSDWDKSNESYAVKIAGPESGDKYNTCNSLKFDKQSFEGYKTIVYARNVQSSEFVSARVEGSKTFVKFVGSCKDCRITTGYNDGCHLYDSSECRMIPTDIGSQSQFLVTGVQGNTLTLATNSTKAFKVKLSSPGRVQIVYLADKDGKQISQSSMSKSALPQSCVSPGYFYYNSSSHAFLNGTDSDEVVFSVPENVGKIQIKVTGSSKIAGITSIGSPVVAE